jgi:hypothetical protein
MNFRDRKLSVEEGVVGRERVIHQDICRAGAESVVRVTFHKNVAIDT